MTDEVKVEQIDREAAAALLRKDGRWVVSGAVEDGKDDGHYLVQAFARHRLAARPAPAEDVVERNLEAQRQAIEACAKVADRIATDYLQRVRETNGEFDEDADAVGVATKIATAIRALRPNVVLAAMQPRGERVDLRAKLTPEQAEIAALALDAGFSIEAAERDFARFAELVRLVRRKAGADA